MKAIICTKYGPAEVLEMAEVKKPVPKKNEILIKIKATSVTVADFRVRSFTIPLSFWIPARLILGVFKPRKSILGAELCGEIEAVGSDVKYFKQGDEVFAATLANFGGYAEYICLPEDGPIALKPENISFTEAATIPIGAATALHYLNAAKIKSGQKILIYGASGSVGTYAVQLAKHFGAEVTAVCSQSNFEMIKSLGADKVVDYRLPDFLTRLEMYDIVFVAIDKLPFSTCNKILKEPGVYLNITMPFKNFKMRLTSLLTKKKIIVGESPRSDDNWKALIKLVDSGVIKPIIDRTYALEEIVEAHRYVEKGHKKGNVAIEVN